MHDVLQRTVVVLRICQRKQALPGAIFATAHKRKWAAVHEQGLASTHKKAEGARKQSQQAQRRLPYPHTNAMSAQGPVVGSWMDTRVPSGSEPFMSGEPSRSGSGNFRMAQVPLLLPWPKDSCQWLFTTRDAPPGVVRMALRTAFRHSVPVRIPTAAMCALLL